MLTMLQKCLSRFPELFLCAAETPDYRRATAAILGMANVQFPVTVHLRSGERFECAELSDLQAFWQIFVRKVYPVKKTDRVILDIGANIGLFALFAARSAPQAQIIAIEPFPSNFSRLLENLSVNNLAARVGCLNYAATGHQGTRTMSTACGCSQRRRLSVADDDSCVEVPGRTLEQLMDEGSLPTVDLLKMDIEGSEYEVILSTSPLVLSRIHRIC